MATTIKVKRGVESALPTLALGELGFTTDTKKLYIGNGVSNTLLNESAGSSSAANIYFSTENIRPDTVNSGISSGTIFGIVDTLDFDPDSDGSGWFNFAVPGTIDTSSNINFNVEYSLSGVDNSKTVYLNMKIWILDDGDTPVEGTPDIDVNESITSSATNTGTVNTITLSNSAISAANLNSNTLRVVCKITRDADNASDTYTGTFKLMSIRAYQS